MDLLSTVSFLIIIAMLISWFIHRNDESKLIQKVLKDANNINRDFN